MESNGIDNVYRTVSPEQEQKQHPQQKSDSKEKMVDEVALAENNNMDQQQKYANDRLQNEQHNQNQQDSSPPPIVITPAPVNGGEKSSIPEDPNAEEANLQKQEATSILPTSSTKILSNPHPLKTPWCFWFLNSKKELDWVDRLKNVCTLRTAEEFWALFDNIRPPSGQIGCDYNLFREGIDPMWEVPQNVNGGRLVVQIEKSKNDLLDSLWLELLLACIGEQFGEDSDQVCGAVCNIRAKGSKISIWTTSKEEEAKNRRIGVVIKDRLQELVGGPKSYLKIVYEDHTLVQQKVGSAIPSRFYI